MVELAWNEPGTRLFETGIDRGVLYPLDGPGVAWNGLIGVDEAPVGGDVESLWYDGNKYLDIIGYEDFSATIEAFHAPPEFGVSDGIKELAVGVSVGQQPRLPFGLCYRSLVGNDLEGLDFGYKLNLVYGCKAGTASKKYATRSDSTEPLTRSWPVNAVPEMGVPYKPTSHLVIDSTLILPDFLEAVEDILYGRLPDPAVPRLITQAEILDLVEVYS